MRFRNAALAVVVVVLLAPALLLTVLRLADPSSARAVQAVAFTPFAIPLYAVALVLLGVVMSVRRTRGLPYAVPAVVALAGLVLHGVWLAPMFVGDAPEPAADAEPVVVMTANLLRGQADGAELVEQVREHDVDILAVSEITGSVLADMEAAGLTTALPYREGLPGVENDVRGTMLFSAEPTTLVDTLDTQLGALVVDTADLRLIAVHPKAPTWPDLWQADHATILAAVQEFDPDLVVGDFNATPDHAPMRALDEAGYRDAVELSNGGLQPTWPVNGTFGVLGLLGAVSQIDHVLMTDDWTATDTRTTTLDGSDHKPVIAVVARD